MGISLFTTFRLEVIRFLIAFLFLLLITKDTLAHCAMCKVAVEQSNTTSPNAFALAALALFVPAITLFGCMLVVIYKYRL